MSEVPTPIVIKTEEFSPAVNKLIMSDNTTLYGCRWPGCNFAAATSVASIGSHYKTHSGKAAQRRRGERKPRRNAPTSELQARLLSVLDQVHDLIDQVDSYEAEIKDIRGKAEAYDAIKGLLNE